MGRHGPNDPCPCGSGLKLKRCCRRLHQGAPAESPEALMRSRYAAYAVGDAAYILATTHPAGPQAQADRGRWLEEVRRFSEGTDFVGLTVLSAGSEGDEGFVSFHAALRQGGRDASFGERSRFLRVEGRWLYWDGVPSR
ncbi:MAG: SEC-C domain-containing protein [Deltaproteobacteria bacterium]|nr:SEC-C domain-containing protein [Deltaproteobacteria bacterium]